MKQIIRVIVIFLVFTAIIQWYGIGERLLHAIWMWYKFKDYGGGGHTTVSYSSLFLSFTLSLVLIAISFFVFKKYNSDLFIRYSTLLSGVSLSIELISLSLLLISPLGQLVSR